LDRRLVGISDPLEDRLLLFGINPPVGFAGVDHGADQDGHLLLFGLRQLRRSLFGLLLTKDIHLASTGISRWSRLALLRWSLRRCFVPNTEHVFELGCRRGSAVATTPFLEHSWKLNSSGARRISAACRPAPEDVLKNVGTRWASATLSTALWLLLGCGTGVENFCDNIEWIHCVCTSVMDKERNFWP
jgi:hypothetical protein